MTTNLRGARCSLLASDVASLASLRSSSPRDRSRAALAVALLAACIRRCFARLTAIVVATRRFRSRACAVRAARCLHPTLLRSPTAIVVATRSVPRATLAHARCSLLASDVASLASLRSSSPRDRIREPRLRGALLLLASDVASLTSLRSSSPRDRIREPRLRGARCSLLASDVASLASLRSSSPRDQFREPRLRGARCSLLASDVLRSPHCDRRRHAIESASRACAVRCSYLHPTLLRSPHCDRRRHAIGSASRACAVRAARCLHPTLLRSPTAIVVATRSVPRAACAVHAMSLELLPRSCATALAFPPLRASLVVRQLVKVASLLSLQLGFEFQEEKQLCLAVCHAAQSHRAG